jgi:hypothetical protein
MPPFLQRILRVLRPSGTISGKTGVRACQEEKKPQEACHRGFAFFRRFL